MRIELSAVPGGVVATIKRALHARSVKLIPPQQGLMQLLAQQTAAGAFEGEAGGGGVNVGQWTSLRHALEDLAQRDVPQPVLHTAITLLTLQMTFGRERSLWQRAHAKGRR